jgi:hypothetical protein
MNSYRKNRFYISFLFIIIFIFSFQPALQAQDSVILSQNKRMWTTGPSVTFKAGTKVVFSKNNKVIQGTLVENRSLWTPRENITFKAGTTVKFNSKGKVVFGTLSKNYQLKLTTGQTKTLKAGTTVHFNNQGFVEIKP